MTTITSRAFLENPIHYFNLARRENLAVKRGKVIFQILPQTEFGNISSSGDTHEQITHNLKQAAKELKLVKAGKLEGRSALELLNEL